MDHLGGAGDHAEHDGRLVGQPGGDHHVLLASHNADTGTVAGVPPRGDGRIGGWQNKSDQPDVGQMAFHYPSPKYAASIKILAVLRRSRPPNRIRIRCMPSVMSPSPILL